MHVEEGDAAPKPAAGVRRIFGVAACRGTTEMNPSIVAWSKLAMSRVALGIGRVIAFALATAAASALAYEGDIHQQLTFIAARQYNSCVEGTHLARLTPLQVRYVAKANANQADTPWWQRMFRWNYYDRDDQSPGRVLWLVETRMHGSFRSTLRRLREARDLSRRFSNLGRVVNYVQDATTPAYVAPVFTARLWRFSVGDRFNAFPVDVDALNLALGDDCAPVRGADGTFESLLATTAENTIASLGEPIRGMPASWEAFWQLDSDADDFGSYGKAGNNFGRQTTFTCTEDQSRNCVLVANDPLYAEYATARHLDAVRATISAVAMMQVQVDQLAAARPSRPPLAAPTK